jgi:hypothetical protein
MQPTGTNRCQRCPRLTRRHTAMHHDVATADTGGRYGW